MHENNQVKLHLYFPVLMNISAWLKSFIHKSGKKVAPFYCLYEIDMHECNMFAMFFIFAAYCPCPCKILYGNDSDLLKTDTLEQKYARPHSFLMLQ